VKTLDTTLNQHLWQQYKQLGFPIELSMLLTQMGLVAKVLSREVSRAALEGELGLAGEQNATGDEQKKLDILSNELAIDAFSKTGLVAAIASEESNDVLFVKCGSEAQYILCIDPLDGSSNTDTGGAIGTIFGFYKRKTEGYCSSEQDALRQGTELIAAGYVMYGASTVFVYSCGDSVNGFTLDPDLGEFVLSHADIRCPESGTFYSANLSYYPHWHPHLQKFVDYLSESHADSKLPTALRYTGALVADFHRSLIQGGLYFYPETDRQKDGKLRLLYECAPLAFLAETAGGRASTGSQRILDLKVNSIHQRSPFAIGSASAVTCYEQFLKNGSPK
jgi:fructose-1,6-bisphosphatase I